MKSTFFGTEEVNNFLRITTNCTSLSWIDMLIELNLDPDRRLPDPPPDPPLTDPRRVRMAKKKKVKVTQKTTNPKATLLHASNISWWRISSEITTPKKLASFTSIFLKNDLAFWNCNCFFVIGQFLLLHLCGRHVVTVLSMLPFKTEWR